MSVAGKVINSTVVLGSIAVGYTSVKTLMDSIKNKNTTLAVISGLTALISFYAFKEAVQKQ